MTNRYSRQSFKLEETPLAGRGSLAELFIVEGDSAAGAVARCRDSAFQAVLPMQGKPLNALRATRQKLAANPWFGALIEALGTGVGEDFQSENLRYARVILLCDPDADGIHCGFLLSLFFFRWMKPVVEQGRLSLIRAPLAEVLLGPDRLPRYPLSEEELQQICHEERAAGNLHLRNNRYRGLAAIHPPILLRDCLAPATRREESLSRADIEAAIAIFGQQL